MSVWTSAALGTAAGAGLWWVSAFGTLATLLVLVGLRGAVRGRVAALKTPIHTVELEYERGYGTLGPALEAVRESGAQLEDLVIDDHESGLRRVAIDVRVGHPEDLDDIAAAIATRPEVRHCVARRAARRTPPAWLTRRSARACRPLGFPTRRMAAAR